MVKDFITLLGNESVFGFVRRLRMSIRYAVRRISRALPAAALVLGLLASAGPAAADAAFERWVAAFRATAAQNWISGKTFDRAFRGVTEPDPVVLEKARFQPEFTAPVWDYFDNRVQEESIANGRQMAKKWKPWLDKIEARYGV